MGECGEDIVQRTCAVRVAGGEYGREPPAAGIEDGVHHVTLRTLRLHTRIRGVRARCCCSLVRRIGCAAYIAVRYIHRAQVKTKADWREDIPRVRSRFVPRRTVLTLGNTTGTLCMMGIPVLNIPRDDTYPADWDWECPGGAVGRICTSRGVRRW